MTGRRSFLTDPYLLVFGAFLTVMAALSFAIPRAHDLAMTLRWPMLGVAAALGIVMALVQRGERTGSGRSAPRLALGLFLVVAAASAAYAEQPLYSLARVASVALLFLATMVGVHAYCQRTDRALALADLWWYLGAALVIGGFCFRQGQTSISGRYEGLHDRATGAGTFAALFLPLAIYQLRYRFTGMMALVGWLVVGLLGTQLVLTGARAALLVSGVVAVALWTDFHGRKAVLGFLLVAVVATVPFVLDPRPAAHVMERTEKILRRRSLVTFTGRLDRWHFGLEQFQSRPLFGHGFGASRTLASKVDPRRFHAEPGEVVNLHSDQIEVLADLGLVGQLFFASFWILLLSRGCRVWRAADSPERGLAVATFGAVFYAFIDSFMHGSFLAAGGGVAPFTWTMIASFDALSARAIASPAQASIPEATVAAAMPAPSRSSQPSRRSDPSPISRLHPHPRPLPSIRAMLRATQ